MTLKEYLHQKLAKSTANRYLLHIKKYQSSFPNTNTATYPEILNYIAQLRKQYSNADSIKTILQGIKHYYSYLVAIGERKDHPCKLLHLKDKRAKKVQLQDLFSVDELELLMHRKERYRDLKTRNLVIISLLIYQGLSTGEIVRLWVKDVDMEKGLIHVLSSAKQNGRTLALKPNQILIFYTYITQIRPKLTQSNIPNLVITKTGKAENGEGINNLIYSFKSLFPGKILNPLTIRQSVISNLLNETKDLRKAQLFAGHKYPSSTEKYKQNNIEELKAEILKYHPLQ